MPVWLQNGYTMFHNIHIPPINETFIKTLSLLPKFHLILPKNFFFPPEEIEISSGGIWEIPRVTWNKTRLLPKSTVSQSCLQDCLDFAERMKRKALRVRSEGSIPPYVTEAESRKQHSDSPLYNSLKMNVGTYSAMPYVPTLFVSELASRSRRQRLAGVTDYSIVMSSMRRS